VADPVNLAAGAGALAPGAGAMMSAMSAFNKSMGAETMSEVTRSADRMVASAKSGGFQVTKEAADPIIKVLDNFIERIGGMRFDLRVFDQAPSLGGHDYGKRVALHMQEAASGEGSARSAVLSLLTVLEKSREALLRASNQYDEQEESARDVFRGMGE
jgi:hypothetical protein